MKTLLAVLAIAALAATYPPTARAQTRAFVSVGIGHPWRHGWNAARWYPTRGCRAYSRYVCYPDRVVIVRRPVYHVPFAVARRDNGRSYGHYRR